MTREDPGEAPEEMPADTDRRTSSRVSLRYVPALDGYRGIGVAVVVLFHFGLLRGGWLGVDLFFVLSGFLITRIVVHERANSGKVDLRNFWRRRARRLLPALIAMLGGVALYLWWYPDKDLLPTTIPAQMWATVFYAANWQTIRSGTDYWAQYQVQSPLSHMWSLSIEEQFYVLFPLVMIGLFALVRKRIRIAWVLLAGAIVSWSIGLTLLASGHDFERVYLGTDTRIGAILLGCTAGYLTCVPTLRERLVRFAAVLVVPAMAIVAAAFLLVDGSTDWSAGRWLLMPLFELAVVVLILASLDGRTSGAGDGVTIRVVTVINRAVSTWPLVWLGTVSYGLYLWHVPIQLWVERAMAPSSRPVQVIVALAISLAVSALSLRVVEKPIRLHGLRIAPRWSLGMAAIVLIAGSITATTRATAPARAQASRSASEPVTSIVEVDHDEDDHTTSGPSDTGFDTTAVGAVPSPSVPTPPQMRLPLDRPADRPTRILLLGDSLAYDLGPGLAEEGAARNMIVSTSSNIGCGLGGNRYDPENGSWLDHDGVAACDEWNASHVDLVRRTGADVVIIFRRASRQPDEGVDSCDASYLDWYRSALEQEIADLSTSGATVVVLPLTYARYGGSANDADDDRSDCLNEVIEDVTRSTARSTTIPLDTWLCPDRRSCRVEVDGTVLRPDGLHFRGPGARIASRWILDQLFG